MQAQVTITGSVKGMAVVLGAIAAAGVKVDSDEVAVVTPPAKKRGRPSKEESEARKAAEEEKEVDLGDEESEEEETEESEDEETEEEETEDEEPAKPVKKAKTLEQVITAFRAYAEEHSREKAAKILTKFKVKSVRDLPVEKYAEVLKLLK